MFDQVARVMISDLSTVVRGASITLDQRGGVLSSHTTAQPRGAFERDGPQKEAVRVDFRSRTSLSLSKAINNPWSSAHQLSAPQPCYQREPMEARHHPSPPNS